MYTFAAIEQHSKQIEMRYVGQRDDVYKRPNGLAFSMGQYAWAAASPHIRPQMLVDAQQKGTRLSVNTTLDAPSHTAIQLLSASLGRSAVQSRLHLIAGFMRGGVPLAGTKGATQIEALDRQRATHRPRNTYFCAFARKVWVHLSSLRWTCKNNAALCSNYT